jgi:regulator of protease activity HflC (stomatin/prohibitin superfamily)
MLQKPVYLLGLIIVFLVAAYAGADRLLFLAVVLLPLFLEVWRSAAATVTKTGFAQALPGIWRRCARVLAGVKDVDQLVEAGEARLRRRIIVLLHLVSLVSLLAMAWIYGNVLFGVRVERNLSLYGAGIYLAVFVLLLLVVRFVRRSCEYDKAGGDCAIMLGWLRFLQFFLLVNIFFVVTQQLLNYVDPEQFSLLFYVFDQAVFASWIFYGALLLEAFIRVVMHLWGAAPEDGQCLKDYYLLRAFFAGNSLKESLSQFFAELLGIDFKKSEIIKFFINIFEPVLIFSILLVWLLSALVIVGPDRVGIFYSMGKINAEAGVEPGIYFKLPWPFGNFELPEKNRIQLVNVGFKPYDAARHFIWTKPHSTENFNLIVGDGLELISIDCQIMFQLKNARKYLTRFQNPKELISTLAYRHLTSATVSSSFDEIMNKDRRQLAENLKEHMQQELDKRDSGIKIVKVVFVAMHPPIEVANAFENVISAQINQTTLEQAAQTERILDIHMHQAFARGQTDMASGDALQKVAKAMGDSQAFVNKALGYNYAPKLTRFRLKLESLEKMTQNQKLYVIDKSFLRAKDKLLLRISE